MIVSDKDKPSLESLILAHHGVAGMKWGIRKAPTTAPRESDVRRYGKSGATRIARNRDKGLTVKQAQHKEVVRNRVELSAAIGAVIVGRLLVAHGSSMSDTIAAKAQANRARNSVTALTKDAAKVNYAKKSFGGAYKIHTM